MTIETLPNGWIRVSLGEIAEIERGVTFPASAKQPAAAPSNVICLRTSNVQDVLGWGDVLFIPREYVKNDRKWLHHHDIVISMANSHKLVGKVALAEDPPADATFGAFLSVIRPIDVDASYLFQVLRSPSMRAAMRQAASLTVNIANLSLSRLRPIEVPVAPLAEQRRIVAKIDALQARSRRAREALEAIPPLIERFRQSVLATAFRGDLTADWRAAHPDVEPASVLLARIRAERRERWIEDYAEKRRAKAEEKARKAGKGWSAEKDAAVLERERAKAAGKYEEPESVDPETEGLSELPEGWAWASVEELAAPDPRSLTDGPFGSNLKTSHYTDSGPRVIRLQNIGDGAFKDAEAHISEEHYHLLAKHAVEADDVVVASLGSEIPRACLVPRWLGPAIVKADCLRFAPDERAYAPRLAMHALNSPATRVRAAATIHGMSRPRIGLTQLRALRVPVPPPAEQPALVNTIDALLGQGQRLLEATEGESGAAQRLERLDQAILAKAFRGELVPQDPDDEPASALLEQIAAGKRS